MKHWIFLVLLCSGAVAANAQSRASLSSAGYGTPSRAVKVNRTVPHVELPKTVFEFSSSPTPQDFFRVRVFEEPLVPIGGEPSSAENTALAAALLGYAKRSGPDDFSSLTGFLEKHPRSSWRAALLTGLGLEYYNTANYSLALEAWSNAWTHAKDATDAKGKAIADRAVGELAYMYARLGRMTELEALLKSVEGRVFVGAATERITGAREGLWNMQNRPEVSFRCGPMALQCIKRSLNPQAPPDQEIRDSASTQKGFSLPQVAELSKKIGLNYRMAFRRPLTRPSDTLSPSDGERDGVRGTFVVPSVVHWKVGHYAALVRREGNLFLLQDPTFGNEVWATKEALEAETSGYFLIPPGDLPRGWRAVESPEGETICGKGQTGGNDPGPGGPPDPKKPDPCKDGGGGAGGMAVASAHLMLVSLNIVDTPVGYSPPIGPPVRFTVRYNQRDAFQPANFTYSNFGPKWTCDWISYITDNPQSLSANVKYYIMGGGTRTFTGFNTNAQSFAHEQYDLTQLKRTGTNSYEMLSPDGSKKIFSQSDGSVGSSRKIFLTQILDPFGNAVTLSYDANLRLVAIADAIGLTSQFNYETNSDFINALITPYGTNSFIAGQGGGPVGTTRFLETLYPDGSRDRVEYNQSSNLGIPDSDPADSIPTGMETRNAFLFGRNTYYWSRTACASGYGDYTKAKIYHWMHSADVTSTAGMLESTKEALEGRVWYSRGAASSFALPSTVNRSSHIGRVLDDGQTQLHTYAYNGFGQVTNMVDPVGRTFSYVYASNGIDLLEARQTRGGNNELLSRITYNAQHLPLTVTDAAGQTNTFTYNARGQRLTEINPKGETTAYTYDTNGYLIAMDGPLPGTNDVSTATYDGFGRTRTRTDVSGYTLTFDYDDMDRITRITHPDSTFSQHTYDRLDLAALRDRAGRQTLFEHDRLEQRTKRTDPLGRVTLMQWCRCGDIKSLTDPMGRTTSWLTDVQGRLIGKQYADGSKVTYLYENASSRLRQVIDEKQQITEFAYNRDDTLKSVTYANSTVPTPGISYTYDPNYERNISMSDGTGTTLYSYHPIPASPTPGAGQLASVDGPLPNDTIAYVYNELGRRVSTAINGVASTMTYDVAGRIIGTSNALGAFTRVYDGSSGRLVSQTFPNSQIEERGYGGNLQDRVLQRITHRMGATPISEFLYGRNITADRITSWSQQVGAQPPFLHTFGYDAADQLLSTTVTNAGTLVNTFGYSYDPVGNRQTEQLGATIHTATHNALNQISTTTAPGAPRTNEWDAKDRLVAVNAGNQGAEFTYDGKGRMVSIRKLVNGSEVSHRRFVWCDNELCEERDASGAVTKRFFPQGMRVETGPAAGNYFYTRDHLGSIRELTDGSGNVRARYAYDPYGRRTRLTGDLEADFGFAGMFFASEAGLSLARFRAYDPTLGRWLSRDPLRKPELSEGPNLYAYVGNNPVNLIDPLGLEAQGCCEEEKRKLEKWRGECAKATGEAARACELATKHTPIEAQEICAEEWAHAFYWCSVANDRVQDAASDYVDCMAERNCEPIACLGPDQPDPLPPCKRRLLFGILGPLLDCQ